MAANTVFRSLAGALLPLAGPKMYAALGLGWGDSLLRFIALAFCAPYDILGAWRIYSNEPKIPSTILTRIHEPSLVRRLRDNVGSRTNK